ncbi:MAG TPA: alpha/beta family hydrolase [Methylomirabilota bacterium]|nr:alpha/beta family hydrolase [Methylomirabilota bacterium]
MPESMPVAVGGSSVTALVYAAPDPTPAGATVILAHGAGLPQTSPFMVDFAQGLARRGCHAVTFNFPYTEQRRRLPDRAPVLEGCFRDVVAAVRGRPELASRRLVIGGKSMGGRMATHLAAQGVADLAGLVVLGYPLHPPGRPQQLRAEHLARIRVPMLVVQGERDAFGTPDELRPFLAPLDGATIHVVEGGDHSFKVPRRGPVRQADAYERVQDEIVRWIARLA